MMPKTIFLLTPVYVTLFWALVLNLYVSPRHAPKAFLGKFMLVAFVVYLSHFLYFSELWSIYPYLDPFYNLASLLVFPLYHIYIRLLTREKRFSIAHHGKFILVPLTLFLLYLPGLFLLSREQYVEFLRLVIYGLQPANGVQIYLLWISRLIRAAFVLQVAWYLYANFRLIIDNNQRMEDYYSNTEDRRLHWVQFFNFSLAATSVASIVAALTGRETFFRGEWSLAGPSIVFSLMLFFIGLLGNTQTTVHFREEKSEEDQEPDSEEATAEGALEEKQGFVFDSRIRNGMTKLFEKEMIFKNPDLKIWDVSQMLGTNRTYVSRFINAEYERNFCNHVNHYRVQYAKRLLEENPDLTNEQIAELSGFGSQNSLYRAFQASEGISYGQYRKLRQKEADETNLEI
ncbi:MAG: helix-turn-helix domain-containing protein [Bacteroidales bacterium]